MRRHFITGVLALLAALPLGGQQTGYLKTKVNPGRAGVFVDGKYLGPAGNFGIGRKYALAAGEHEVKLVDPRYEDFATKVQVQAGKTTRLQQQLKAIPLAQPPFGRLRVVHPDKYAAVYINDRYFGHADEFSNFAQGILLNPGSYNVRVEPLSAGKPLTEKVTIEADKVTVIRGAN